ncbi:MAG: DUF971 domain-containing protein [Armatimonadota bacterium]|nr:DUF971 domain-containing protein [Armatimonadota bacterium]MDR7547834.1 DUF971 domain-containing protein [Armatimonadota bacterium]MDR7553604.1 DUF971 domain-containing protein [Armatimonadota bacterium]MDR7559084.1 DUF971 domain-containing protein [Armatimonadota bacterium]
MAVPVELGSVTDSRFWIVWSDGHRSTYTWQRLRLACPCARCKGEWGERPDGPTEAQIPATIRAMRISRVGAYALRFSWMDGHDTGLYPFPLLRHELCECEECTARRAGASRPD